jgi:hypothetical protein
MPDLAVDVPDADKHVPVALETHFGSQNYDMPITDLAGSGSI